MAGIAEKFSSGVAEAERLLQNADRLLTVTFPAVKDSKLLAGGLEELFKGSVKTISLILQFEYLHRKIVLTTNPDKNFEIFMSKCAQVYGLDEAGISDLRRLMELRRKHKESSFEFSKKGSIIMLDREGNYVELRAEDMKNFLIASKKVFSSLRDNIRSASERYK